MDFMFDSPAPKATVEYSLFLAASRGKIASVKEILSSTALIDVTVQTNGFNPVQIAARKGHSDIVRMIVQAFPTSTLGSRTENGRTLQMIAAFEGHTSVLQTLHELLKEHGEAFKEFDDRDILGNTSVHYAAWGGSLPCVQYLIEVYGASHNMKNDEGILPMQFASAGNHTHIVKYMMNIPTTNTTTTTDVTSSSSSTLPNSNNEGGSIDTLIDGSNGGVTSIHRAASYNALDTLKLIVSSSTTPVDINQKTANGSTALHLAAKHGYTDLARYLVDECNAEVDIANDYGLTALHFACIGGYKDMVQLLITRGGSVLLRSSSGETALHLAAAHGKHDICAIIAAKEGVDLFVKDNSGGTPIEKALTSGFKELALKIAMWSCVDLKTEELLKLVN